MSLDNDASVYPYEDIVTCNVCGKSERVIRCSMIAGLSLNHLCGECGNNQRIFANQADAPYKWPVRRMVPLVAVSLGREKILDDIEHVENLKELADKWNVCYGGLKSILSELGFEPPMRGKNARRHS